MELLSYELNHHSRSDVIELSGLGDIHLGSAGCDKEKLKEKVERIRTTPNAYWIGMGDYIEAINPTDKRFDPYSIDPEYKLDTLPKLITRQITDIAEILYPIRKQCICLLCGNHEETARTHLYRDVAHELCVALGATYGGYDAFIRLRCLRRPQGEGIHAAVFTLYASHGFGSARRSGAKINRLEDVMDTWDADIVLLAHEHQKVVTPPRMRMKLSKGLDLEVRHQIGVMTGSWLKSYVKGKTIYAEKSLYRPNDLGTPTILITPSRKLIEVKI